MLQKETMFTQKIQEVHLLSPYIRHGLLSLSDVWKAVEKFEYKDRTKFQDELLWQEFSRHLYAIVGKKSRKYLNYKIEKPQSNANFYRNMNLSLIHI